MTGVSGNTKLGESAPVSVSKRETPLTENSDYWFHKAPSTANHVMSECRDEFHLITQTELLNNWVPNSLNFYILKHLMNSD